VIAGTAVCTVVVAFGGGVAEGGEVSVVVVEQGSFVAE
jgi:hypothetical protein